MLIWSVDALAKSASSSKVHDAVQSQPLCTAVQIALVDLLRSWGINAEAAAGHSSGKERRLRA